MGKQRSHRRSCIARRSKDGWSLRERYSNDSASRWDRNLCEYPAKSQLARPGAEGIPLQPGALAPLLIVRLMTWVRSLGLSNS